MKTFLPRVWNKLNLCVNPMATMMPDISRITVLDKYNLTGRTRFDKSTECKFENFEFLSLESLKMFLGMSLELLKRLLGTFLEDSRDGY